MHTESFQKFDPETVAGYTYELDKLSAADLKTWICYRFREKLLVPPSAIVRAQSAGITLSAAELFGTSQGVCACDGYTLLHHGHTCGFVSDSKAL
jgi:hypothetical protein